jgi:hypothetical protein
VDPIFTSVGVKKVIVNGADPEDEGPAYICLGDSITLRALPEPSSASFPNGTPTWSIEAPQGSGIEDPENGATAVITPDEPGEYVVEADCGSSSDGFTLYGVRVSRSDELWWFGGEDPANYDVEIDLIVEGLPNAEFSWDVISGEAIVTMNGNTVISTAASDEIDDVTIRLTYDGQPICDHQLTVRTPHELEHLQNLDSADANWGYETRIRYRILDQFGDVLPDDVEVNEQWTGAVVADSAGMDWRRGAEGSNTLSPAAWDDRIQGETAGHVPAPVGPAHADAGVAVYHWPGAWFVGSLSIGNGVQMRSTHWNDESECVWQKYRGRARHE